MFHPRKGRINPGFARNPAPKRANFTQTRRAKIKLVPGTNLILTYPFRSCASLASLKISSRIIRSVAARSSTYSGHNTRSR